MWRLARRPASPPHRRRSSRSSWRTRLKARSAILTTAATRILSAGISSATPASARWCRLRISSNSKSASWNRIISPRTTTRHSRRRRRESRRMATRLKGTDVVIVGLGAAGGVAALPLAQAGLDVIGLEAGSWLTRRDFAPDELRNNYRGWPQAVQKANQEIPTSRATASSPTAPRGALHPMQNGVGGTTLHYWAQSWRLNPWDFKVVSETTRRYGAAKIPKGSTVEDWPFGYDELEAYYDKIEYEVGISGQAGNINGTIDPRGNRFEGPRKRAYPMPPLRGT